MLKNYLFESQEIQLRTMIFVYLFSASPASVRLP